MGSLAGADNHVSPAGVDQSSAIPVSEPATMILVSTGFAALLAYRRRRMRKKP